MGGGNDGINPHEHDKKYMGDDVLAAADVLTTYSASRSHDDSTWPLGVKTCRIVSGDERWCLLLLIVRAREGKGRDNRVAVIHTMLGATTKLGLLGKGNYQLMDDRFMFPFLLDAEGGD